MSGLLQPSSAHWLSSQGSSSGLIVKRTVRVDIPVEKYPNYNFVGRLLGPRGNSLKRVEASTECRVLIRGRGSIKDPARVMVIYYLFSVEGRDLQRYDNQGRHQVVGCIPYRFKNNCSSDGSSIEDELEVIVIASQKGGQGLVFPKGGWELDESVEEAASRESLEEAGVLGHVEDELGKWNFLSKRNGTFYKGCMFPSLVTEQLDLWPEKNLRQRIWMSVEEARDGCRHWWMKEALDILVEQLTISMQQKEVNYYQHHHAL